MLVCPTCRSWMSPYRTTKGRVSVCLRCGGRAASLKHLSDERSPRGVRNFVASAARQARSPARSLGRPCPHCSRRMAVVRTPGDEPALHLDVCPACGCVWFDPGEYEHLHRGEPAKPPPLPARSAPPAGDKDVWPHVSTRTAQPLSVADSLSPSGWQYIPALLGFPIEMDPQRALRRPLVTYTLTGLMAAIFVALWAGAGLRSAIADWGFLPNQWLRHDGLTILASFLLHAGWMHLLSNGYFLAIFGDNVEDRLGAAGYALLLAASHAAGLAAHAMLDPHGNVPLVGASAGISGVIACYAVMFPRARIGLLPGLLFLVVGMIRIPAILALLLYVVLQAIGAAHQIHGFGGISYVAHLGGLAVGAATGLIARAVAPGIRTAQAA